MWTMAAPASYARFASSAISTGVYGMAGQCFFVVTAPVSAQDTITLSSVDTGGTSPRACQLSSGERERGYVSEILDDAPAGVRGDERALVGGRARAGDEADAGAEGEWHGEVELEDVADDNKLRERGAGFVQQRADDVVIRAAAQEHRAIEAWEGHLRRDVGPRLVDVELARVPANAGGEPRHAGRLVIEGG